MNIIINCNLDRYPNSSFPKLSVIPRKGEKVAVRDHMTTNYPYPRALEVVGVTYYENKVEVDLWYDAATHKHIVDMNYDI